MDKSYWLPKLSGFLDLGSQASNWEYNNKSRYYFVGLSLDIPLFAGGKNRYKIRQSELNTKNQVLNTTYVNRQLQLSAEMAKNDLKTSYQNYVASTKQLDAAASYNKLIEKGYKEGLNSFIETIDARNQLTVSSLQVVINKYQLMAAIVNYEREINK